RFGRWWHPHAGLAGRAGSRLTVRQDEAAERSPGLVARHLLLDDRRDDRLEDGAALRQPDSRSSSGELPDEAMVGAQRRRIVLEPCESGRGFDGPLLAGPPRRDAEL